MNPTGKAPAGRWLPAESVVVLSHEVFNQRGVDRKRPVNYGSWQVNGRVAHAGNGDLLVLTVLMEPPQAVLVRSTNAGQTWSEPTVVWRNPAPDRYHAYVLAFRGLRGGRLLAVIQQQSPNWLDGPNLVWPLVSDDHGRTWRVSPESAETAPFITGSIPSQLFEDKDGTVHLPFEGPVIPRGNLSVAAWIKNGFAVGFLKSRDGGVTWKDGDVVLRPHPSTGYYPTEHAVLPLPGGEWLMLLYARWADRQELEEACARSISRDGGRTWSSPRIVWSLRANHGLLQLPDGGILHHAMCDGVLKYWVSYDAGQTWAYEQLLDPGGDIASSSVVLDERTVFVLHSAPTGPPAIPGYWDSGLRGRWIRTQG